MSDDATKPLLVGMSKTEIVGPPSPPAPRSALTPMEMLALAVERGADLDVLEKLMDLQERHERNQGRKAFDAAMAEARAEMPVILKNRVVDFVTEKGHTHYQYEDLAAIAEAVGPILGKHGLSYRFRTTSPINEPITVTCIVSHRDGYSEENTLIGPRDATGNKNSIQQIGSTLTYLQRMTLKAALGLAASADDDGRASSGDAGDEPITQEQLAELQADIDKAGADIVLFCEHMKVDALMNLLQRDLPRAKSALALKLKQKQQKARKGQGE